MKRVIFSIVATVVGVVALLSFKTRGTISSPGALPSAALPSVVTSAPPSASAAPALSTAAPPDPTPTPSSPAVSTSTSARPSTSESTPKRSISPAPSGAPKTYVGSAEQTPYGIVQVEAKIHGRSITSVSFVQLTAFDPRSAQINGAAAPILLRETLAAQSARIDSVSGATYTSNGYTASLQSALDQAGL